MQISMSDARTAVEWLIREKPDELAEKLKYAVLKDNRGWNRYDPMKNWEGIRDLVVNTVAELNKKHS